MMLGLMRVCPMLFLSVMCALLAVSGCQRAGPLDPVSQPRTPYQQYQILRGEDVPLVKETALGEKYPNLRGRLVVEQE